MRGNTLVRALLVVLVGCACLAATTIARADDPPPTASFHQAAISVDPPGGSETTQVSVQVDLSAPAPAAIDLGWQRSDGGSGSVHLNAGDQTASFGLDVGGDGGTSFTVSLSSPDTSVVAIDQGTLTVNVNPLRTLSATDTAADPPGLNARAPASVTVSLDAPTTQTVTADWTAQGGTAAPGFDYPGGQSGTVTIAPNSTSATIQVAVSGNGGTYFFVQLSNVKHAKLGTATAKVTINPIPVASVAAVTSRAPVVAGGTRHVDIPVSLTRGTSLGASVSWTISQPSGSPVVASGTLSFAPGATAASIPYDITAAGSLLVKLSDPTNVKLATGGSSSFLTILTLPKASAGDVTVAAPGAGQHAFVDVPVTLDEPTSDTATVAWSLAPVSGRAGVDYVAASGTLTFAPGQTSKTVTVQVMGNGGVSFNVVLSNPFAATLGDANGSITITQAPIPPPPPPPPPQEQIPTLSIGDAVVAPPASGAGPSQATLTVTLSATATKTVTVAYATKDATAKAGADYTPTSGTLTFAPGGATTKTITVPVLGGNGKTFDVDLSSPTNATLTQPAGNASTTAGEATVTITSSATLSINDVSLLESNGPAVLTVTLSSSPSSPVTVDYTTTPGTATAPASFTATQGTLTFPPGTTTQQITVPIVNNALPDGKRVFTVTLSNPSGAVLSRAVGQVTINDDDGGIQIGGDVGFGSPSVPAGRRPLPAGGSAGGGSSQTGGGAGGGGGATGTGGTGPTGSTNGTAPTGATAGTSANALLKATVTSLNLGTGSVLRLRLACAASAAAPCVGTVTVSTRPTAGRIGRATFHVTNGRTGVIPVRLTAGALKTLKRKSTLRTYVVVTGKSGTSPLRIALNVVLRHTVAKPANVTITVPGKK